MKKNKVFRRMLKTALAVTLAGSMLVGCGGGGDGSQKSAEGTATAVSEREPGELRIGVVSTVDSIAPFVSFGDVLTQVRFYMWEYLGVPDENKELTPQIAKSWTTNDNGYTYEVEIYDYVTDSAGNAITANDVAFSYETYKACGRSSDLTNLESITVTGDYTLELKLTSNAIGVFDRVASGCPIVSQAAYESSGDEMAQDPIGTAAYIVSEFEPGASLTLTEREDYWQTDELRSPMSQTNLDKMTFKFINDASQCAIALETNDVDVSLFPTMKTLEPKRAENKAEKAAVNGSAEDATVSAPSVQIDLSKVKIEPLFADDVDFETFSKSDFRVVKIEACEAVPKSKKLLKFTLNDGTDRKRTILSGIHEYYEPEELVGKTCVAITNLPPRKMMGIDSEGMLISAVYEYDGREGLNLLMLDDSIPAGAKLY